MSKVIDIHSKGEYPANVLSNFYPNAFEFDGVQCASMEGFLQSLKFKNKDKQVEICSLVGIDAKKAGKKKWLWKLTGNIYWQGKKIKRTGRTYKNLLFRVYGELLKNERFAKAIEDSYWCKYTHSIGKSNKRKTILTEEEFIFFINKMRSAHIASKCIGDIKSLIEIADKGDAEAQFELACRYKTGDDIEQNSKKAFEYYYLSSGQGHHGATLNLAHYYFAGTYFVKQDLDKAIKLYKIAADAGLSVAQDKLASIYGALNGAYNKRKAKYYLTMSKHN